MRISSLQIFNIANQGMSKANEAVVKTQEQLSTGQRVLKPSDDPVASTKIMQLSEELSTIEQYRKNIDIAENNLDIEESTLSSVTNLLKRMEELAVQAGNTATLSTNEYQALASEVDARLDELVNLLNTQNSGGDFIFGGYKSTTEPFVGSAQTGFDYLGDEGQQFIKIANNTTIAASDSGKAAFVDIESAQNTVRTYPSPANRSQPPVNISVGQVFDQQAFDEFYPEDMVVTFNADTDISPPGQNFTVTERSTGQIIAANQSYTSGEYIELEGVRFRITGSPVSGTPAVPATLNYGADAAQVLPQTLSAPGDSVTITVNGRSETFQLNGTVSAATPGADIAALFNTPFNQNDQRLARLGISVDATGFSMPEGVNFSIRGGTAAVDAALGLNTAAVSTSSDGELAKPGDRVFLDSSNKQDVLTTLARFSEAMKTFDGTQESRQQLKGMIANTLDNLKNAQTSVSNVVSELGARNNTLESIRSLHQDGELVINDVLSELRDTDYAEAATRLSAQSLILQAAQSSFVRVSRLTLFSQL